MNNSKNSISFTDKCIESIEKFTLSDFDNKVINLFLNNNKLKYLHKNTFNGLENLRLLNLSYNEIESIEPESEPEFET